MKHFLFSIVLAIAIPFLADAQKDEFKLVNVGTNAQFNARAKATATVNALNSENQDEEPEHFPREEKALISAEKFDALFEENESMKKNIKAKKASPATLIPPFFPNLGGVDPMIAAGDKYLIIENNTNFGFYDKNGNLLGSKPGGIGSSWSSGSFFQPIIDAANSGSFSNLNSAPDNVLKCNSSLGSCKNLCQAYDVRVIYEPVNKKFIIACALRNTVWRYNSTFLQGSSAELCNKYATRIFAFAISNTNDPRDGFKMWYWTKNNYRDWPAISADKDVLTVTHYGGGPSGVATPTIYVISLKDMMNGVSSPRFFTYFDNDGITPGSIMPVAMFKKYNTTFDNSIMYMTANGSKAELYYFKKSANMWTNKPELKNAEFDLGIGLDLSWYARPVYRNGDLYFDSRVLTAPEIADKRPNIWGFILYRLPLKVDGSNIAFNDGSSKILKYKVYPPAATTTEYTSYEVPSISVDKNGTILASYGRLAKTSAGFIYPEARYFLLFESESSHRTSKALKTGEFMPMYKKTGWTKTLMDGPYKYTSKADDGFIDYSTVTADPSKDLVFWIAHVYADKSTNAYKLVTGEVKADK